MTASIESPRGRANAATSGAAHRRRPNGLTVRVALAATFVAILVGAMFATGQVAQVVASLAAFVTAISLISAGAISWERVVVDARSAGLVEPSH